MSNASLNERVFDALMAAGKRSLADEYAAANGGDDGRPRQRAAVMTEQEALRQITRIALDPTIRPSRALVKIIHMLVEAGYARRTGGSRS